MKLTPGAGCPPPPEDFSGFIDWFDRRSELLARRLQEVLQVSDGELIGSADKPAARDDLLAHSAGE